MSVDVVKAEVALVNARVGYVSLAGGFARLVLVGSYPLTKRMLDQLERWTYLSEVDPIGRTDDRVVLALRKSDGELVAGHVYDEDDYESAIGKERAREFTKVIDALPKIVLVDL